MNINAMNMMMMVSMLLALDKFREWLTLNKGAGIDQLNRYNPQVWREVEGELGAVIKVYVSQIKGGGWV